MNIQLKYIKCEVSRRELWESQFTFFHWKCHAGNCGKVNLHFFTVNYTMTSSFSLPKTVKNFFFTILKNYNYNFFFQNTVKYCKFNSILQ